MLLLLLFFLVVVVVVALTGLVVEEYEDHVGDCSCLNRKYSCCVLHYFFFFFHTCSYLHISWQLQHVMVFSFKAAFMGAPVIQAPPAAQRQLQPLHHLLPPHQPLLAPPPARTRRRRQWNKSVSSLCVSFGEESGSQAVGLSLQQYITLSMSSSSHTHTHTDTPSLPIRFN